MSYEKFYPNGWQSGETGGTPITPEALNHIENGIEQTYKDFAPAGYGLGGDSQVVNTGWHSIAKNGYYYASPDNPIEGMNADYWAGEHIEFGYANRAMQRIWYGSEIVQRMKWDGVWQPWEWVNPPMVPGVEYRTTERWNGKVVYCKAVDFGNLPNSTIKNVGHGTTVTELVRHNIVTYNSERIITDSSGISNIEIGSSIGITTNTNLSAYQIYFAMWYTKD